MATASWSNATYQEIAAVLADTENGLTGREIGDLLASLNMADPAPSITKRDRLTAAFVARHNHDEGDPKRIITFITRAMEPVRYRDRPELFTLRQDRLNERLAFVGLHVNDEGRVAKGAIARIWTRRPALQPRSGTSSLGARHIPRSCATALSRS